MMNQTKCIAALMLIVCASGCALQPAKPGPQSGCCYLYEDYPWGDYPWEGRYYNPGQVWDDYYHDYGTLWHGQEGEQPQ